MGNERVSELSEGKRNRVSISSVNDKTVDTGQNRHVYHVSEIVIEVQSAGQSAATAKLYDGGTTGTVIAELKADQRDKIVRNPDPYPAAGKGNDITASVEGDSTATVVFDIGYYDDQRPSGS